MIQLIVEVEAAEVDFAHFQKSHDDLLLELVADPVRAVTVFMREHNKLIIPLFLRMPGRHVQDRLVAAVLVEVHAFVWTGHGSPSKCHFCTSVSSSCAGQHGAPMR